MQTRTDRSVLELSLQPCRGACSKPSARRGRQPLDLSVQLRHAGHYPQHRASPPPATRRRATVWLSRDPIEEIGFQTVSRSRTRRSQVDLNLYGFVLNDPLDQFDLLGLQDSGSLNPPSPNQPCPNGTWERDSQLDYRTKTSMLWEWKREHIEHFLCWSWHHDEHGYQRGCILDTYFGWQCSSTKATALTSIERNYHSNCNEIE